jgi:hypothetical protein
MTGILSFHRGQLLFENAIFNITVVIHFLHMSYKTLALNGLNKGTPRLKPGMLDPGVVTPVQRWHRNPTIMTHQVPAITRVEQAGFSCI